MNLRKPMGMVLAERSDGKVFVESITEGGNAAEQGSIQVKEEIAVTYRTMLCGNKISVPEVRVQAAHGLELVQCVCPRKPSCTPLRNRLTALMADADIWQPMNSLTNIRR